MTVTIYHNPNCGTSRNTLAMIRASGEDPVVVDYLAVGWSPDLLRSLAAQMGMPIKALVREKGTPAGELGLLEDDASDDQIISAMIAHPVIVNRPIVATSKGTRLCRPSEVVFELLDNPPPKFTKEDGEVVSSV
ncbi:arsenate reductase (glutaredoxin) [Brevundimonas sp. KM4]|uniref:arsenate reductase (glutaredoxin) n=1 Tax=Brevundimonas sp. KM4 TaxID=1628191 RepID=UPI0005F81CF5|nr:arsenate reductase (glutaredoxin) [Brevundimonas sp. KM4]KJV41912.1 arsenate reductase [Brevundimonas sp. KM4]